MKAFTLAFTLVTVLLASPVFGQQPTDKPEIPPWDGAIFANGVSSVSTHADIPRGRCAWKATPAIQHTADTRNLKHH